jgi:hypothetical protein
LVRWRKNAFTVALVLCMMHLSFACLVTCWVDRANDYNLPLMAIHPGVHIFEPMLSYRYSRDSRYGMVWSTLEVLYAMALALNMLWLFWWLCRHYEVLSGRKEQGRTRMIKPQVTSTALSLTKVSSQ